MDTKRLRQRVLDLAIHGKLVPQNPQDEPASELLKRIAAEKERLIKEGKIKKSKKKDNEDIEKVPFEVPQGWVWTKLPYVTTKITDGTHHSPESYPKGDYLYVTAKNIKRWGIDLSEITYVDKDTHNEIYSRCNPEYGDILYIKDGATTGIVTINTIKLPFSLLSSVALIKPSKEICNKYLLYYLQSSICYDNVRESMKGVGITRITLRQIETWSIPLPPLAEQHRIVSEVEKYFSLIDILEENENDLQQSIQKAKSKILDLAIKGKLVEKTGEWEYTNLGSVFQHNTGKALNRSAEQSGKLLPYITTSNLYWGRFELDTVKSMYFKENEIEKCTVTKGDLLVCEGGDIGRSAIWDYDYDICIQNHIHRLRPIKDALPKFYYYVMMHYKRTDNIEGKGIGMLGLSSKQLDKLIIPFPPLAEQHRIVARIEELFTQLDNIAEALK